MKVDTDTHPLPAIWSNVYGAARTLLAMGTLATLLANDTQTLFVASESGAGAPTSALHRLGLFWMMDGCLEAAHVFAALSLVVVASGWRPRWTGVIHWWISFSFACACVPLDGGDHVASVLTLLLLPMTLLDPRRSHWDPPAVPRGAAAGVRWALGRALLTLVRLQVALIYFHAAIAKVAIAEWKNGTVLYYWLTDPMVGVPSFAHGWLDTLLASPWVVVPATWSALVLELLLFMALTMSRRHRAPLLVIGLVFHASIVLAFGLVSFFFSMAAALVLLIRPWEQPFSFPWAPSSAPARMRHVQSGFSRGDVPDRSESGGASSRRSNHS